MKLIVGLGNPGKQYEKTRHNSGFLAMSLLADKVQLDTPTEKFEALVTKGNVKGVSVILMEPLTYMNESGRAVSAVAHYYKIEPEEILVMHDDMDLPVGSVRIRTKGSSGGQKGMQNIMDAMQTQAIARIRIGVGHEVEKDVPDYVLSPVPKALQEIYQQSLETAASAAYAWIDTPMNLVMNQYNTKVKSDEE